MLRHEENMPPVSMELIQLTDLHIAASEDTTWGLDTYRSFDAALSQAARSFPNAELLLTGDLAQEPVPETYERIRVRLAEFKQPVHCIPGNHDDPRLLEAVLRGGSFETKRQWCADGWQIVLLDSTGPHENIGTLADAELEHLERSLSAQPELHTLVCLHHHPVPIRSRWMDAMALSNPEPFLAILDRHTQVRGVIFGHIHQAFEHERKGVRYLGSPSTCVQFVNGSPEFATTDLPPGFRHLELHADGSIATKVHYLNGNR
jgi:3',5'-cyclic-AMP phosphodiesterase